MNEPIVSPWLIYWAGRIDMIQGICCIIGFFVTIYAMFATVAVVTDTNKDKESIKAAKIIVCTALVLDILGVFLPTDDDKAYCGKCGAELVCLEDRVLRKTPLKQL